LILNVQFKFQIFASGGDFLSDSLVKRQESKKAASGGEFPYLILSERFTFQIFASGGALPYGVLSKKYKYRKLLSASLFQNQISFSVFLKIPINLKFPNQFEVVPIRKTSTGSKT